MSPSASPEMTRPRRLSGTKRSSDDLDEHDLRQPEAEVDLREAAAQHDNKVAEMKDMLPQQQTKSLRAVFERPRRESLDCKPSSTPRFTEVARKVENVSAAAKLLQTQQDHTVHSMAPEECAAFTEFINHHLGEDAPELAYLLPISSPEQLFSSVTDGVLLSRLINIAAPETIDERVINLRPRNPFHVTENHNLMINAAKSIGLKVINIGSSDLVEGRPHLVLGLLWQLVKMALLNKINLRENPFLIRLLKDGETLQDLLKLPPEQILLRWINFHLANAGSAKRVHNFGADLADSEAYATLLQQIDPDGLCSTAILRQTADKTRRAEYVVKEGSRLQKEFRIRPADIASGHDKLNLAFCAALFNACPGLEPVEAPALPEDDEGDSREERAFRMWINSLGIETHVADLFEDMKDGTALLQLMDAVQPGVVDWRRVNKLPKNVYQRLENLNHSVKLATTPPKDGFGFSLVGVQGKDIADGNKKLTLALIWQLRRHNLLSVLAALRAGASTPPTDDAILKWANDAVAASGSTRRAASFADAALGDALFLADLLNAVRPGAIAPGALAPGATEEERKSNAKYVLSVARKLGCTVFVLWEDIVESKPKMMFSFIATLMHLALSESAAAA